MPSLYERCSYINEENVALIDYAAFFGSVKCFKYLLMNGANVINAGKYAVAGGNEEIIHLCEQNHSSFEDAYETAIKYHRNDVFKYLYENKLEKMDDDYQELDFPIWEWIGKQKIKTSSFVRQNLVMLSFKSGNFVIFAFLEKEGVRIEPCLIDKAAQIGNLYIVKYLLQYNSVPFDILLFSLESENNELTKFLLEQKGFHINARDRIHINNFLF